MFDGQEMDGVMATAFNHAAVAMLFALEHMDEYAAYIHGKQAEGVISTADWDATTLDTEQVDPRTLAHDLSVAAALISGLGHIAQERDMARMAQRATSNIDSELSKLLGGS